MKRRNTVDLALVNRHLGDLNPLLLGYEDCTPGHSFGPAVRQYTLIHYVRSGKGKIYKGDAIYEAHAGEAFLILPHEVVTYTADGEDPWSYRWIGFDGALSERFATLPTIFPLSEKWLREMILCVSDELCEYRIAAVLLRMYATLFAPEEEANDYVRQVRDYIRAAYMQDIHVEEIADRMNLNRRYLSRLFKARTGKTVQDYLIDVRMSEAKKLLAQNRSVAEAAVLCGYQDVFNFSKMFKRRFGISPRQWWQLKQKTP